MRRPQRGENLFEHQGRQREEEQAPVAARMRPRTLDEFLGQEHLVGAGKVLERAIRADLLPSMILWGPPGSGKTTLALLIARASKAHFTSVSAVTSGVAELRQAVAEARERLGATGQRTILFVDEVHRFNKGQQDVILPHVENGTVTLIGATTENPSFEVNAPLLSRCRVFTLKPLTDDHLTAIVRRALIDQQRGIGGLGADIDDDALAVLLAIASGDARTALNGLEIAAQVARPNDRGVRRITKSLMEEVLQSRALRYDRAGEGHYDTISAFIKSVRASDPDAAIYWLARMIEAGEDPLFIARRIVILAAEDIGMADPQALPIAVAAQQAVRFIGLPEGAIPLAEATVYLAAAPKSNTAYMALNRALETVREGEQYPVPLHLRNAPTGLMRQMGYGRDYKYAHDYPGHFAGQGNLPPELAGTRFYEPGSEGHEAQAKARLLAWWCERSTKPSP
ncbi:MAG: replication-associated recombination protein A [SAR202 cluster bacterium]|nr:replication-associated recombination protein A [SAR202 cluster bacterium]